MGTFRHFSENLTHYGLECPKCKRVLNVERSRVVADGAALRIVPTLLCPCGASGELLSRPEPESERKPPQRAKNDAKEWLALVVIIGLVLLLCFGFYSCDKAVDRASAERDAEYHKKLRAEQDAAKAIIEDAIKNHRIMIGMSRGQVIAAWGTPEDINRTITPGHVAEQFCYPNGRYAYLTDGVLTAIQD